MRRLGEEGHIVKDLSRFRLFMLLLLLTIGFVILEGRMAWVQLLGMGRGGGLERQAFLQQSDQFALDSGRGQFLDRHGKPLTGITVRALVAFPTGGMPHGTDTEISKLAMLLGTEREKLKRWLSGLKLPEVWIQTGQSHAYALTPVQAAAIQRLDLGSLAVLPYTERYAEGNAVPAIHAIGYISQNPERLYKLYAQKLAARRMQETDLLGGAGLESSLDRMIRGVGETRVIAMTDGSRRPLDGRGLRVLAPDNPHYPLQVRTTLDLAVQQAVAQVLKRHQVKEGAVVVLDAANADIVAMVSLPSFHPGQIGRTGEDERNHALLAVPPGSIFKTVTLAAALEAGVTTMKEKFRCQGDYGRYGLSCWLGHGHGVLTVEEAYAESCNVVFAALAERLDPQMLRVTADRLGLGRQVGWQDGDFVDGKPLRLLEEEQAGSVFANGISGKDGGVRTGTGIGQRDVRVTPLQAANLAVTLLHEGRVFAPRLVREIRYADGGVMAKLPVQRSASSYGQIKPRTAAALRKGMRSVVLEGTGATSLGDAIWPLAGKSGTADLANKHPARNDQWFVGYAPAIGQARYAVSVLVENQSPGTHNQATVVFGEVMEALRRLDPVKPKTTSS